MLRFRPLILLVPLVLVTSTLVAGEQLPEASSIRCDEPPEQTAPTVRQSSVWLISTRHLGPAAEDFSASVELDFRRHQGEQGWQEATLAEFLAADGPDTLTLFYVHGNRIEWDEALQNGWQAHDMLVGSPSAIRQARFVIWSWPSDQIRGVVRDVRSKAQRSSSESFYLAWLLAQLDPETPVSLVGFSYGARIITGAMHCLGGGEADGAATIEKNQRARAHVVLMAAALNDDWLVPHHRHGQAHLQIDELLLLNNSSDPVLKRYRLLDGCRGAEALGYVGFPCRCTAVWGDKITQIDAAGTVGRTHRECIYLCSAYLMTQARRCALWENESSDE
jgi:hypothetical protein